MGRRFLQLVALAAVSTAALVAAGGAGGASGASSLHVTFLNGFEEVNAQGVPGQGDLDALGVAIVSIDTTTDTVCWLIAVSRMQLPAAAAHIHAAPRRVNGPIVVPLTAPNAAGFSAGCVVDSDADAIAANPSAYYVNVHNASFPGGAVRGQLD